MAWSSAPGVGPPLRMAPSLLFPNGWVGTLADLRAMQTELSSRVCIAMEPAFQPVMVAGVDAGLEDGGATVRAAAVLLDARNLRPLAQVVRRMPTPMSYVPGLLSFRELPVVLAALAELPMVPDLVLCDGHGIAHPRRLGIAAHLGVVTGLRAIGVAKRRLVGQHDELAPERGSVSALLHGGERIGTVLRTRANVAPVFVSPGHRMGIELSAELALAMTTRYRLPEPTRLADRLASRRGEVLP